VQRAVRNAARYVGARRAAEQIIPAAQLSVRPAAHVIGQIEQADRPASPRRRLRDRIFVSPAPVTPRPCQRRHRRRAAFGRLGSRFFAAGPVVGAEPQPENHPENRGAGHAVQSRCDLDRGFAVSP
jgi:hypothetical protein